MDNYFFQSIEFIDNKEDIYEEEDVVVVSKLDYTFTEIVIFEDEEF